LPQILFLLNRAGNFFSKISILNPEQVAPVVIGKMMHGKEVIIPGAINQLSRVLDKLLPSIIKKLLTDKLMKNVKPVQLSSITIHKEPSPKAA